MSRLLVDSPKPGSKPGSRRNSPTPRNAQNLQSPFYKKVSGSPIPDFMPATSSLQINNVMDLLDETLYKTLATRYKFYGMSFSDLCEHNTNVCNELLLFDKAQTWQLLKLLCSTDDKIMSTKPISPNPDQPNARYKAENDNVTGSSSSSEEDGETTDDTNPRSGGYMHTKFNDLSIVGQAELDAVFGDGDDDYNDDDTDMLTLHDNTHDWSNLPNEAIQLRHTLSEKAHHDPQEYETEDDETHERRETDPENANNSLIPTLELPSWNFTVLIKDMLYHYAELGDIQMSVTCLLVLQERSKLMVDWGVQEEWYHGYIEMLHRMQLWNVATEVINHSEVPVINSMNSNSTLIHLMCGSCNKKLPSDRPSYHCQRCPKLVQTCVVCHTPVKGLYVWCQGCGHGGHIRHLKLWYSQQKYCPSGCGHKCEYS